MTPPTMRPLSFDEILDGTFTLYRRNFPRFAATSFLLVLGQIAGVKFLVGTGAAIAALLPGVLGTLLLVVVSAAVLLLAAAWAGTLTWQADRDHQDRPAPLGESLAAGSGAAIEILGASAIAFAVVYAVARVGLRITGGFVDDLTALDHPGWGMVATIAGVLVTGTAVLFVGALLFGVVPVVVIEEKGPVDAIIRSVQLAREDLPRIMGILLATWTLVILTLLALLALCSGISVVLAGPGGGSPFPGTFDTFTRYHLISIGVFILARPFKASMLVLLYHDRRVRTEIPQAEISAGELRLADA